MVHVVDRYIANEHSCLPIGNCTCLINMIFMYKKWCDKLHMYVVCLHDEKVNSNVGLHTVHSACLYDVKVHIK